MRVGIIQPNFIPWRGYFDFIQSVDLFILLDDVQFTKRDWRTRNKIKTPQGVQWLVVPIQYNGQTMRLPETLIDETQDWRRKHARTWQANYAAAPFFADVCELLRVMDGNKADMSLTGLNRRLIEAICQYLSIPTPIVLSSDYHVAAQRGEKLIELLECVGASRYLSGPSANDYLDKQMFLDHNIALEYKSYDYAPYPQLWGQFDGAVTVLDLIANCGKAAREHLCSLTPDSIVVEASAQRRVS